LNAFDTILDDNLLTHVFTKSISDMLLTSRLHLDAGGEIAISKQQNSTSADNTST